MPPPPPSPWSWFKRIWWSTVWKAVEDQGAMRWIHHPISAPTRDQCCLCSKPWLSFLHPLGVPALFPCLFSPNQDGSEYTRSRLLLVPKRSRPSPCSKQPAKKIKHLKISFSPFSFFWNLSALMPGPNHRTIAVKSIDKARKTGFIPFKYSGLWLPNLLDASDRVYVNCNLEELEVLKRGKD